MRRALFEFEATASVASYGTFSATVKRFYEKLLDSAKHLSSDSSADEFSFGAAISLAGTAAEVAAGAAAKTIVRGEEPRTGRGSGDRMGGPVQSP